MARHLSHQLLRIDTGSDTAKRFPDLEPIVDNALSSGQCARFFDEQEKMRSSSCVGSDISNMAAPVWFSALLKLLFVSDDSAKRIVSYNGTSYGTIVVSSDAEFIMNQTWREMKYLFVFTGLTILVFSILVYVVISRALAPIGDLVSGLNRLSAGEFSYRLPVFRLSELHLISEVSNQLAERIESTLLQHSELLRRLMNAQENERRHLARELHDEFAQNLTAISALAASIKKETERGNPALRAEAESLAQISTNMMKSLRETLFHLKPADLEKFGLAECLRQLTVVWGINNKIKIELDVSQDIDLLSDAVAIHIFRIVQEGLTNVAKHANAKHVWLHIGPASKEDTQGANGRAIKLTIDDDGIGWSHSVSSEMSSGMGIINMRERVTALGGSISFGKKRNSGFSVLVVIPVDTAHGRTG
ncbi:MAG: sensor histidine kinase [Candidatus Thiodiazotropha sp.]